MIREFQLADWFTLGNAVSGGVPFPIPANGAEAMWNYKMRWVGEGRLERYSTVFSQPGDGKFVPLVQDQVTATPLGNLAGKPVTDGNAPNATPAATPPRSGWCSTRWSRPRRAPARSS